MLQKSKFVFPLLLLAASTAIAQEKFSLALNKALQSNTHRSARFTVNVLGSHQANLDSLKQAFYTNGTNRNQRVTALISELKQAATSQKEVLNEIKSSSYEIKERFWIVNMMTLHASRAVLEELEESKQVERIELHDEHKAEWHKPVSINPVVSNRSPNGIEPGIDAIGTRFLWNLGYTGRNQKVLNFDTGIWPEHPSFRNQWMGKRGPIDQAWFGYDKARPGDKTSHGTHTNSTCMGLDPTNNDTMGIAYNAYFMATYPIVDNAADIKSYTQMAKAYQWAIDPDGDPTTVDDMPNVINNSWGRAHQQAFDTVVCDGFFGDVLQAVELAGIVSVQSAGNEGPGAETIGSPSNRNATLVNNFSVGAVNGNVANFPIANFSSRGPSQCGGTGALLIKPEVVAPGVNVRGAVRNDDGSYSYSLYSGTSMAGPHAAGLALLLTEAFPQATAEEIKLAMYLTAQDLGVQGEDNTFGNGMINAQGAFQHLSQMYTPVPPVNNNFDLKVEGSSLDTIAFTCSIDFAPQIRVEATPGFSNWSQVNVEYGFTGEAPQSHQLSQPPQNGWIQLPSISVGTRGFREFYCHLKYTGGNTEGDVINNRWYHQMHIAEPVSLPYFEDFENTSVYRSEWFVHDDENDVAFDTARTDGLANSLYSARVRLGDYKTRDGQIDGLYSPLFDVPDGNSLKMHFDLAYSSAFDGFNDSLKIWVSADCGATWMLTTYQKGPNELKTDPLDQGFDWVPTASNQWRTDTVDLSAFMNEEQLMIKFETVNQKGGNLYLDNINIFGDQGPLEFDDRSEQKWSEVKLIPNPANDYVQVDLGALKTARVELIDLNGRSVMQRNAVATGDEISVEALNQGVYLVVIQTDSEWIIKKLVLKN